jgi:hypothetical protein
MGLVFSVALYGLALLRFGGWESVQSNDGSEYSRLCSSLRVCEQSRTPSSWKGELCGYRLDGIGCVDRKTITPSNQRRINPSRQQQRGRAIRCECSISKCTATCPRPNDLYRAPTASHRAVLQRPALQQWDDVAPAISLKALRANLHLLNPAPSRLGRSSAQGRPRGSSHPTAQPMP